MNPTKPWTRAYGKTLKIKSGLIELSPLRGHEDNLCVVLGATAALRPLYQVHHYNDTER